MNNNHRENRYFRWFQNGNSPIGVLLIHEKNRMIYTSIIKLARSMRKGILSALMIDVTYR